MYVSRKILQLLIGLLTICSITSAILTVADQINLVETGMLDVDYTVSQIRTLISLCLLLTFLAISLSWRYNRIFAVFFLFGILAIYVYWYSVKFAFAKAFVTSTDSIEYEQLVASYGLLKGANSLDYGLLVFVAIILPWIIFSYRSHALK